MATIALKVARIGNSRGVRLPAASVRRYRIGQTVVMDERADGILLRPTGPVVEKLSWTDTAREMAPATRTGLSGTQHPPTDSELRSRRRSDPGGEQDSTRRQDGTLTKQEAATLRRVITETYGE